MKIWQLCFIIVFPLASWGESWAAKLLQSSPAYLDPFKQQLRLSHNATESSVQKPRLLERKLIRFAVPSVTRRKYDPILNKRKNFSDFYFQGMLDRMREQPDKREPGTSLRERAGRGTMRIYRTIR